MKNSTFLIAATLIASLQTIPVWAKAGGEGNNTGCNGVGNPNSPCAPSGGAGGSSSIGDVKNTNDNSNDNSNTNSNNNLNTSTGIGVGVGIGTGGAGGEGGRGGRGGDAASNASATGGNATGGSAQGGAGGSASANNSNTVSNVVNVEAQERAPVSTATAPGLQASNGACMGSSSAGAQGVSFGLSVGSTWVDEGCDARYDANALVAVGDIDSAIARLCAKPEIRAARKAAGKECPQDKQAPQQQTSGYTGNDPYVLRRLAKSN